MPIARPANTEFPANSPPARYIGLVAHTDALHALHEQKERVFDLFRALPPRMWAYRYAPEKWTVLEMLGHMVDVERIMFYRALSIARGEAQSLPGFDEDDYVRAAHFTDRSPASLLDEYRLQRDSNLLMAAHLPEAGLLSMGRANNTTFSARAFVWLVAGHELHHLAVLTERYL